MSSNIGYHFVKKFSNQGKQGVAGIVKDDNGNEHVFKTSRILNFLMKHEYKIMESLSKLCCPHFCKSRALINHFVDVDFRKKSNLFESSEDVLTTDTLIMEYLPYRSFYSSIRNKEISDDVIYSCIKQVLIGMRFAQLRSKFTHYDLHSSNILMTPCNPDNVHVYLLDNTCICIPTHGYYPKIIDYGFSYCDSLKGEGIYSTLAHTNVGFMTNRYDPLADAKLFLLTSSDELNNARLSSKISTFRKMCRNIFSPLRLTFSPARGSNCLNKKPIKIIINEAIAARTCALSSSGVIVSIEKKFTI